MKIGTRAFLVLSVVAILTASPSTQRRGLSSAPVAGYRVVHVFPHDPEAFTQGLVYLDGVLYEGTGLNGRSTIRKVRLENGEVLQIQKLESRPARNFTDTDDRTIGITPDVYVIKDGEEFRVVDNDRGVQRLYIN